MVVVQSCGRLLVRPDGKGWNLEHSQHRQYLLLFRQISHNKTTFIKTGKKTISAISISKILKTTNVFISSKTNFYWPIHASVFTFSCQPEMVRLKLGISHSSDDISISLFDISISIRYRYNY